MYGYVANLRKTTQGYYSSVETDIIRQYVEDPKSQLLFTKRSIQDSNNTLVKMVAECDIPPGVITGDWRKC